LLVGIVKVPNLSDRIIAYTAIVAFCALSSARDVISEFLFKRQAYKASPIFVLFVYSAVTQLVCVVIFASGPRASRPKLGEAKNEIIYLNLFTAAAFALYFAAIRLPLGAGMNSFVDYGSGPIFTALVAAHMLHERLDRNFVYVCGVSLAGLLLLNIPRFEAQQASAQWLLGIGCALLSSVAGAYYTIYYKMLIVRGLPKSLIITLRLALLTMILGFLLAMDPELFRIDLLSSTAILGLIGFTLPLFLILNIVQRVTMRRYSILLFLVPALKLLFSIFAGYETLRAFDILGAGILILAVGYHEASVGSDRQVKER
jgi:drug/metabolite transporter (DMT)-like permease